MKTIKGPGIFLAQFAGDTAPFNTLEGMAQWAAGLGFTGRADSKLGPAPLRLEAGRREPGLLRRGAWHCGQRGACGHGAIDASARAIGGHACGLRGAVRGLCASRAGAGCARAAGVGGASSCCGRPRPARNLGLNAHATFSGALAWPFFYPWPQRPAGLIDEAFEELGRRWLPILDAFEEAGVDVCYELHPGEDLHDGATFERFLDAVGGHQAGQHSVRPEPHDSATDGLPGLSRPLSRAGARVPREGRASISASGRSGVYGGYQDWIDRPGRFRSLGDGQIDFNSIFSKMAQYDYPVGRCWSGSAA